jgi:hypothetical protein
MPQKETAVGGGFLQPLMSEKFMMKPIGSSELHPEIKNGCPG